ncbi:MAG: hypothetical protein H0X30_36010 [Anaerolineae bacterium]|nr:hypothetical protein [Anaerolineae bacterium]
MRLLHLFVLGFVLLGLSFFQPTEAQGTTDCPSFIQTALQQLGNNCSNSPTGSACYGNSEITTSYANPSTSATFSKPGDRVNLGLLNDIHTSAVDIQAKKWGLALLSTQANLPKTLNSKGVVMVALGDVQVQNAVLPADELKLADKPITVLVGKQGSDLFNVPTDLKETSSPFGHVPTGTPLQADGVSPDGKWLRVFAMHDKTYFQTPNAWVKVSELSDTVDLKTLPVIGPNSFTLMQSFDLNNGLKPAACDTDPTSMLYLQGPEQTEVLLHINGTDVRFGSTMLIRILPPGNIMQFISLTGIGVVKTDGQPERVITPGFASQICLSEPSDKGVRTIGKNCSWSEPSLLSFNALEALYRSLDGKIPQNLQYYRTYVPRLICPSGVGQVQCRIRIVYENLIRHLRDLCQRGLLPKNICDLYILS